MRWSRALSGPPSTLRARGRRRLASLCALGLVALATLSPFGCGAGDGGQERKPPALAISWAAVPSPPGGGIWALTMAPSDRRVIYAATRDYNVPKTTNGGRSWSVVGERRFGAHIFAPVVVDPADARHLYVTNGTVHESRDGGRTWRDVLREAEVGVVWSLALDPAHPATLYAGTRSGVVLRSRDGGATWAERATLGGMVGRLVHHPSDGRTLYAAVPGDGLYASTDGGARWQPRSDGLEDPGAIRFAEPEPAGAGTLYVGTSVGLFRTTDGGRAWARVQAPASQDAHALGIGASGRVLYLGLRDGMYRSDDAGATWTEVTPSPWLEDAGHGLDLDILVDPADASTVYVGHEDGVLKSTDGGSTWRAIHQGLADDMTFTLAVDPQDPRRLWVGNFWTRGIFVTGDAGRSWSLLHAWRHAERGDHYPMEIVFHPADSRVVYVTGAFGLKKTTDGGATWASLGEEGTFKDEHTHGLAIDPVDPEVLYVGTGPGWEQPDRGAHVYKTTDGGRTWVDLASGFPTGTETQAYVIAVAPSDRDVVYVGTNGHDDTAPHREAMGVYRSANGGASWRAVNTGLPNLNVYALAVHPEDPDTVFVGLGHGAHEGDHEPQGVFRTTDGGRSWERVAALPDHEVSHVEFRPGDPRVILVSFGANRCAGCDTKASGRGVWGTADGGRTWVNLSSPAWTSRQRAVMDVVFDASGSVLYAGTDDGVFRGTVVTRPPA